MKKSIFILSITVAVLTALMLVGVASANGGPHGGYTATTDACAGCHRAHTALGPNLLVDTSTTTLCLSCHGTAGTGADTNVTDGFFLSTRSASVEGSTLTVDNNPLNGGGFTNYQGVATTSSHDVSNTITAAWGNGANRGVTGALAGGLALNCASCHDPHGSANYRIINASVNSVAVAVAQVDEGAAIKDYDNENWGAGQSDICAACHSSYHVISAGSGSDAAVAATGGYAHRVDMAFTYGANANPETIGYTDASAVNVKVPLAGTTVVCQTCHLPHGSSAAMTGYADGGPTGAGTQPGNTTATDSALLRLNNRAVCEACHQK